MTNPDRGELVKLEAERAELIAKNEAATSWGAAVGARYERIIEIDRRLAALTAPGATEIGPFPGEDDAGNVGIAPGATTKSDGGDVITSEQMDAIEKAAIAGRPLTEPFAGKVPCHCHDDVSQRLCLDKDRCYTVEAQSSPSNTSSTRSDVTALTKRLDQVLKVMRGARNRSEPMAVWADDIKAIEDARALLDQFEIRSRLCRTTNRRAKQ